MYDLVLKECLLMDGYHEWCGDLAINGEKIAALGEGLAGKRELAFSGKWVMPGAIDVHTHMNLTFAGAISADSFLTGTQAAAWGGVTTIIDFTAQNADEGIREGYSRRLQEASEACIDYSFHACIGRLNDKVRNDIEWAADEGLTSLKIFMAYRRIGNMLDDDAIYELLEKNANAGILTTVHAENGPIIDFLTDRAVKQGKTGIESLSVSHPVVTEVESVRRISSFASETKAPVYIVHLSAGSSVPEIRRARKMGTLVFAETCPQYLYLDDSNLQGSTGHMFGCCPPIRPLKEQVLLWDGLRRGEIQVVATDHCPFTSANKNIWNGDFTKLPMGLPGIETLPAFVLWGAQNSYLDRSTAVRALTGGPARMFGLYPEKGSLIPGTDADILVFDPEKEVTIAAKNLHMATDYSPYEGTKGLGWPVMTISRGEILVENGKLTAEAGRGRFLARSIFSSRA